MRKFSKVMIVCVSLLCAFILPLNAFALSGTEYTKSNGWLYTVYKGSQSSISSFVSTGQGGNYVVHAPYTYRYNNAVGYANLPSETDINTLNGRRVPCMAFTLQSGNSNAIDFGVEYINGKWITFVYSQSLGDSSNGEAMRGNENYPNAKLVGFNCFYSQNSTVDKITCYFNFMDANGSSLGQTVRTYTKPLNTMFVKDSNGRILVRWMRFMSLLPGDNQADNANDGSYFRNAKFTYLSLHDSVNNTQVAWSYNSSLVEKAWSVRHTSSNSLSFDSSGQTDTFSITQ